MRSDQSVRAAAETLSLPEDEASSQLGLGELPRLSLAETEADNELVTKKLLGQGGMGKVELAIQRSLRREVAVKSVHGAGDGAGVRALLQEALYTGLLEHPNIVPVHQLGKSREDLPLLVMKRVEGVSWRALIEDAEHAHWKVLGEDHLREHIAILISVCNAVEFAHSRGIVHRDIKPENVMVGAFGEVYLLDWGLAMRLDDRPHSRQVVGTPCHMAPEMLDGAAAVDERTDVYLLAACLHMALTGRPRHTGEDIRNVIYAACKSEPASYPPEVPKTLGDLCNQAMHVDPDQRPQSAADLRRALERYLEHRSSIQLAKEATHALRALRAALGERESDPERVAGLVAECRFGFGQALRAWPENDVARDGLQECLTLLIERELERRNPGMVEALLAELPTPSPELQARLLQLQQELSASVHSAELLSRIQRDFDFGVFGRQRAVAGVVTGLVWFGLVIAIATMEKQGRLVITHTWALTLGVVWLLVQGSVIYAWRSTLLKTRANRRVAGCTTSGAVLCMLNHGLGILLELPVATSFVFDGLVILCELVMMAWTIDLRLFWVVPIGITTTVALALWPGDAIILGAGGLMAAIAVAGWLWRDGSVLELTGATESAPAAGPGG